MSEHFVIIGAGHAGGELAIALREAGFDGAITLIGDEPHAPYQRPPLSKAYLTGGYERTHLFLRNDDHWHETGVDHVHSTCAEKIDRSRKSVLLDSGAEVAFTRLAVATGARPRLLPVPGAELDGVIYLRTIADADRLVPALRERRRLAVIGGGYIGLEIAASARKLGLDVTVIERLPRLLARVASEALSAWVEDFHRGHGVDLKLAAEVARLEGETQVEAVRLGDGERIEADVVVVGIGVVPNCEIAERAGLATANGIIVDEHCRTSDPDIFAAGDVAEHPNRLYGRIRLESVQNAVEQAKATARNMLGRSETYDAVPWFWSDQFDTHIQIAGLSGACDRIVCRAGRSEQAGSLWSFRAGRLIAVEAMNDPRSYMLARRWLAAGITPDPDRVADPGCDLKKLVE